MTILKHLFPIPKLDSKRVMTFANDCDYISFRHHVFAQIGEDVQLIEVGPRFEMQVYEIRLGLLGEDGDLEWVYKPYQNTASKRQLL